MNMRNIVVVLTLIAGESLEDETDLFISSYFKQTTRSVLLSALGLVQHAVFLYSSVLLAASPNSIISFYREQTQSCQWFAKELPIYCHILLASIFGKPYLFILNCFGSLQGDKKKKPDVRIYFPLIIPLRRYYRLPQGLFPLWSVDNQKAYFETREQMKSTLLQLGATLFGTDIIYSAAESVHSNRGSL